LAAKSKPWQKSIIDDGVMMDDYGLDWQMGQVINVPGLGVHLSRSRDRIDCVSAHSLFVIGDR
jgi:hypothetical protein